MELFRQRTLQEEHISLKANKLLRTFERFSVGRVLEGLGPLRSGRGWLELSGEKRTRDADLEVPCKPM